MIVGWPDISGYDQAEREVVKRVLRIKAQGAPLKPPVTSTWPYGTGPARRTIEANGQVTEPAAAKNSPGSAAAGPGAGPSGLCSAAATAVRQRQLAAGKRKLKPVPCRAVKQQPKQRQNQQLMRSPGEDHRPGREQTGYPEDMLDLDLDMEADLGIDTVKQAETFAAIQEEFDIPASDDLTLRDYNTIEKVIAFVKDDAPRSGSARPLKHR